MPISHLPGLFWFLLELKIHLNQVKKFTFLIYFLYKQFCIMEKLKGWIGYMQ